MLGSAAPFLPEKPRIRIDGEINPQFPETGLCCSNAQKPLYLGAKRCPARVGACAARAALDTENAAGEPSPTRSQLLVGAEVTSVRGVCYKSMKR